MFDSAFRSPTTGLMESYTELFSRINRLNIMCCCDLYTTYFLPLRLAVNEAFHT